MIFTEGFNEIEHISIIHREKMLKSKRKNVKTLLNFVLVERAKLSKFPGNTSYMLP